MNIIYKIFILFLFFFDCKLLFSLKNFSKKEKNIEFPIKFFELKEIKKNKIYPYPYYNIGFSLGYPFLFGNLVQNKNKITFPYIYFNIFFQHSLTKKLPLLINYEFAHISIIQETNLPKSFNHFIFISFSVIWRQVLLSNRFFIDFGFGFGLIIIDRNFENNQDNQNNDNSKEVKFALFINPKIDFVIELDYFLNLNIGVNYNFSYFFDNKISELDHFIIPKISLHFRF